LKKEGKSTQKKRGVEGEFLQKENSKKVSTRGEIREKPGTKKGGSPAFFLVTKRKKRITRNVSSKEGQNLCKNSTL